MFSLISLSTVFSKLIREAPLLLLAIALCANALSLYHGTSGDFQRLGSLWIAVTLMVLALQRSIYGLISKPKSIELARGVLSEEIQGRLPEIANKIQKIQVESRAIEIVIGAASTLQWGYGDLFHCWFNGNGWRACG